MKVLRTWLIISPIEAVISQKNNSVLRTGLTNCALLFFIRNPELAQQVAQGPSLLRKDQLFVK
jgi:hypothetical protein